MTQAHPISLSKLQDDIHKALKLWYHTSSEESPLGYLLLLQQAQRERVDNVRQATNEVLLEALKIMEAEAEEGGKLLRLRFLDQLPVYLVANQLNVADITVQRMQRLAIEHLAKIIQIQEARLRDERRTILESRLELPTYEQLIGVEDHLNKVLEWLINPTAPWLISIEGIGGLGKTSLADAISRRVINEGLFEDFGWVSARQRTLNFGGGIKPVAMPALTTEDLIEKLVTQLMGDMPRPGPFLTQEGQNLLRTRLKQSPHLIVIDNLETVIDVESLLPTLRDLAQPSKFLLTSRESLPHESGVFHFRLPELSESNALRLIRYEAYLHGLDHLEQANDTELKPIFETVGGNPLALRLVVGQTHVHALKAILNDLRAARGEKIETLYTFIYRQAWDNLNEMARRVWLAMPLASEEGARLEYLAEVTALDQTDLVNALYELVRLNLVNSIGDLTEYRYTIHHLTRTFLQTQVARWQ